LVLDRLPSERERRLDAKIAAKMLEVEGMDSVPLPLDMPRRLLSPRTPHHRDVSRSRSLIGSSVSTAFDDSSSDDSSVSPNNSTSAEKQSEVATGFGCTALGEATCEELPPSTDSTASPETLSRTCSTSSGKKLSTVVSLGVAHSAVYLHVYDLHPLTRMAGLPLYHTGVEVHECECAYGSKGLQWVHPGCYMPRHREAVYLGPTHLTAKQVVELTRTLAEEWRGCDYHLLKNNCQTFSVEFCRRLGVPKAIPEEFLFSAKWT